MSIKNGKETDILHKGYVAKRSEGSAVVPIFMTTTYNFSSAEQGKKAFISVLVHGDLKSHLIYSRVNHPNAQIVEERIACLEKGGESAAVFTSGMAAITTILQTVCERGKTIVYTSPLYGGTYDFLAHVLKPRGYKLVALTSDIKSSVIKIKKIGKDLGLLFIETPANPTLEIFDIESLCLTAKKVNPRCVTVLDNTFMGIFQQGFAISRFLDLIVYSGTKFLGGHSDLLSGVVISRKGRSNLMKKIKIERARYGNILHPFGSFQLTTHIETCESRMEKLATIATCVAKKLEESNHPKLLRILHPSLFTAGTKQYNLYKKQCSASSSIISLWLKTGQKGTFRFLNKVLELGDGIIQLAVSLGSVETLMCHPRTTTHSEMSPKVLDKCNITKNLVRLSVGQENPEDLVRVILEALDTI